MPQGTDIAGCPVTSKVEVFEIFSNARAHHCSSVASAEGSGGAFIGVVGVSKRS